MTERLNELIEEALVVIAAITGQSVAGTTEMFDAARATGRNRTAAGTAEVDQAVQQLCTRIGLAPALEQQDRRRFIERLRSLATTAVATTITVADLHAWDQILRSTPEQIPTVECGPVQLPAMPEHQQAMWETLMDFERSDPPPWVLIGGQMTALRLAENGITAHRPTDDGDLVVGV